MPRRSDQYNREGRRWERDNQSRSYSRSTEDGWNNETNRQNYDDVSCDSNNRLDNTNDLLVYIDPNDIGRLVGRGGSKIRALEEESHAKIHVNNNSTLRTCRI